ncbi:hypothetical protein [Massilia genomosp. 1]|uniref:hypothetical protein n=1 Tax=Massilia genomosp. 1 TaxID=2609280 RepID=UPI001420887C|nr:hypothetical protein [Massilia genomosp. 1]
MAVKLFDKPSSLRSEKREAELDRAIATAIEKGDKEQGDIAFEALAGYILALLE